MSLIVMCPYRNTPTIVIFAPFIHTFTLYNIEWWLFQVLYQITVMIKRGLYIFVYLSISLYTFTDIVYLLVTETPSQDQVSPSSNYKVLSVCDDSYISGEFQPTFSEDEDESVVKSKPTVTDVSTYCIISEVCCINM